MKRFGRPLRLMTSITIACAQCSVSSRYIRPGIRYNFEPKFKLSFRCWHLQTGGGWMVRSRTGLDGAMIVFWEQILVVELCWTSLFSRYNLLLSDSFEAALGGIENFLNVLKDGAWVKSSVYRPHDALGVVISCQRSCLVVIRDLETMRSCWF